MSGCFNILAAEDAERVLLPAPAQEVLENVHKVFNMGLVNGTKTIYQGEPSPEVDQAWMDLYNRTTVSWAAAS